LDHADIHSQHQIHDNPVGFFQNNPHDTFHNNQALDELQYNAEEQQLYDESLVNEDQL